jgi:hypothetical protein
MKQNKNEVGSAPQDTPAAMFAASLVGVVAENSHKWGGEAGLGYRWDVSTFPWDNTTAVTGLVLASGQFLANSQMGKVRDSDAPIDLLVKFALSKAEEFATINAQDKANAKAKLEMINGKADQDAAWMIVEANALKFDHTLESRDLEGLEKAYSAIRRYQAL